MKIILVVIMMLMTTMITQAQVQFPPVTPETSCYKGEADKNCCHTDYTGETRCYDHNVAVPMVMRKPWPAPGIICNIDGCDAP